MWPFQPFPTPPPEIVSLVSWLVAPETLFAFFLLFLKLPFVVPWPDWKKGAVYVVSASVVSGVAIGVEMIIPPDLMGKLQPFYTPFVILLNLVLGYYGVQAVKGPAKEWWHDTLLIRRSRAAADLANRTGREPDDTIVRELLAPRRG